jgi:hypothetical protein
MREKIHNFHVQGFINPHMQECLEEVLDARLQEIISFHGDIFNLRKVKREEERREEKEREVERRGEKRAEERRRHYW